MKLIKRKVNGRFARLGLKLTAVTFVFYAAFVLVSQNAQINSKKLTLAELNSQLDLQNAKNDELKRIAQAPDEANEEYFVRIARDLNLAKHKERIFVNVSGN